MNIREKINYNADIYAEEQCSDVTETLKYSPAEIKHLHSEIFKDACQWLITALSTNNAESKELERMDEECTGGNIASIISSALLNPYEGNDGELQLASELKNYYVVLQRNGFQQAMNYASQNRAVALLQRVLDLEPLIAYGNDVSEEHRGEAEALNELINSIKEHLATQNITHTDGKELELAVSELQKVSAWCGSLDGYTDIGQAKFSIEIMKQNVDKTLLTIKESKNENDKYNG